VDINTNKKSTGTIDIALMGCYTENMLIDQFNNFLQEASKWPASFWGHKLYSARKSFILQLDEMKLSFKQKDSAAYSLLESLITTLNQPLNELSLAEKMLELSAVLEQSEKKDAKLALFSELANKFLKRARLFDTYQKKRAQLTIDAKQKKEYDQRLFANEGVFYCLEYYLAVFKQMTDLKTPEEKKFFIEDKEIDLGFGRLSGLKEDFNKDEILEKFILLILDNTVREHILTSYYACRNAAVGENLDISKFEKVYKKFIYYLLLAFKENGVEKLSSHFFKPYGDQLALSDLIIIFESYE
jgi:hypothetical protein